VSAREGATDAWRPAQYERFRDERARPFEDLFAMIEARPGMRVLDLGSGTGELTVRLAERLGAREAVGVDLSKAMHADQRHPSFAARLASAGYARTGCAVRILGEDGRELPDPPADHHVGITARVLPRLVRGACGARTRQRTECRGAHARVRVAECNRRDRVHGARRGIVVEPERHDPRGAIDRVLCSRGCHDQTVGQPAP